MLKGEYIGHSGNIGTKSAHLHIEAWPSSSPSYSETWVVTGKKCSADTKECNDLDISNRTDDPSTLMRHPLLEPLDYSNITNCETDYLQLKSGHTVCGYHLTSDGKLSGPGIKINNPFIATTEHNNKGIKNIPVKRLILYPSSPSGRYKIMQGCDDSLLCWSVWMYDNLNKVLHKINAGKYGPEMWVSWSPNEKYAVLVNYNEGVTWLHSVDTASGKSSTYPKYQSGRAVIVVPDSIDWLNDQTFTIVVANCEDQYCEDHQLFSRELVLITSTSGFF